MPPRDGGYHSNRFKIRTSGTDFPDTRPRMSTCDNVCARPASRSIRTSRRIRSGDTGSSRTSGDFTASKRHSVISILEQNAHPSGSSESPLTERNTPNPHPRLTGTPGETRNLQGTSRDSTDKLTTSNGEPPSNRGPGHARSGPRPFRPRTTTVVRIPKVLESKMKANPLAAADLAKSLPMKSQLRSLSRRSTLQCRGRAW